MLAEASRLTKRQTNLHSMKYSKKYKKKEKKNNKGFGTGTCTSGRELWRRKHFCSLRNSLTGENKEGELGISEGNTVTGAHKAKWRIHHKNQFQPALHSWDIIWTPTAVSGSWVLWLRHRGLNPREKTRVDCHEYTLRGLVQHSWGSPRKGLGLPERHEIIVTGQCVLKFCVL